MRTGEFLNFQQPMLNRRLEIYNVGRKGADRDLKSKLGLFFKNPFRTNWDIFWGRRLTGTGCVPVI